MLYIPLFIAGITDLRYRQIPNWQILLIFVVGTLFSSNSIYERVAGFIFPAIPLFFIALKYQNLKGGDIKYIAVLGASVGIYNLATIIFYVLVISLVYASITKKKSVPLAFVGFIGYVCRMLVLYLC
ncbi:MAG: prepilin peptidase [Eubacteriales bacterium]|nr:prepilin peptidase [Eubacteriales bacterium]